MLSCTLFLDWANGKPRSLRKQSKFGATAHDNYCYFNCESIGNFTFDLNDYCISSGQPWNGFSSGLNTNQGYVDAVAGRHGESECATWFVSALNGGQAVGINSAETTQPSDLNFAFTGNMSFTLEGSKYKLNNVVMGQGHFGSTNNWWFGGQDWQKYSASWLAGGVSTSDKLSIIVVGYTASTHGDDFTLTVQSALIDKNS